MNKETVSPDNTAEVAPLGDEIPTSIAAAESAEAAEPLLPVSVGQSLRRIREAKGISPEKVSQTLKLSLRQIKSIEEDDWENLPCAAVARGFVRNYARLLEIPADPLMSALDTILKPQKLEFQEPNGAKMTVPEHGKISRSELIKVLSALLVLGVAIAIYFIEPKDWLQSTLDSIKTYINLTESDEKPNIESLEIPMSSESLPTAETRETMPTENQPNQETNVPPTSAEKIESGATMPTQSTPQPLSALETLPSAPSAESATTASKKTLKFNFREPSWVEVRNKKGEVLFSQHNSAGSQKDVSGEPPFTLVVGNASYVNLTYQGKSVDLSRQSKDGVARLTLP